MTGNGGAVKSDRKRSPRHAALDAAKQVLSDAIAQGVLMWVRPERPSLRCSQCGDDARVVQVELLLEYEDSHGSVSEPVCIEITMREIQG